MSVREFLSMGEGVDYKEALHRYAYRKQAYLNKRLGVLSGGQLRRVLIASALRDNSKCTIP